MSLARKQFDRLSQAATHNFLLVGAILAVAARSAGWNMPRKLRSPKCESGDDRRACAGRL